MEYMRMNLHDKRFRSKASSASRLSPNKLAFSNKEGFIFLRSHPCDTVSGGGEVFREDKNLDIQID
jgi:hypothetical protein